MKNTNFHTALQRVFSMAIIVAATASGPLCAQEDLYNQDNLLADGVAFLATSSNETAAEPAMHAHAMPSFTMDGQYPNIQSYIADHLEYPEVAHAIKAEGLLKMKLEIKADGSVGEVLVLSSPGKEFEEAFHALIHKMPRWNPALKNGNPVDGVAILQLHFRLQ